MAINWYISLGSAILSGILSFMLEAKADSAFSRDECRAIAAVTTMILNNPATRITENFRAGIIRFIAPEGAFTCDGPVNISMPTKGDEVAYAVIVAGLYVLNPPIDLNKAGIQPIK